MYLFDPKNGEIKISRGGYLDAGLPIEDSFVQLGHRQRGMLYQPVDKGEKSKIAIIAIHSDGDYSTLNLCGELAKRGYTAFGGQVSEPDGYLDDKLLDVKRVIEFLKGLGAEKIVLMGHSGGATLMSCYQAVAENGQKIFQGDDMLIKINVKEDLVPADGIMTVDSNWGNGSMTLFSVDPAVVEEGNGMKLDPELDLFNPKNGYDPEGSHYSEAFLQKFFAAQAARNNAIIDRALERLHALEAGKGNYVDDEPFIVTGGSQIGPLNKIFPQDVSIFAHTKKEYPLLRAGGSATNCVVPTVRPPRGGRNMTGTCRFATVVTSVRHYLNERAVLAGPDYKMKADCAEGILWDRSYDCTPANIKHVHVPILCVGFTGSYEYLAAEEIYQNVSSADKSIAFIEGASHMFFPADPKWGDTEKVTYDRMDQWLGESGRFL